MKRYTAAQARQRLSEVLDAAESKQEVVIERRGVRFSLKVEAKPKGRKARRSHIEFVDPAVEAGQWTWEWGPGGLEFADGAETPKAPDDPARH